MPWSLDVSSDKTNILTRALEIAISEFVTFDSWCSWQSPMRLAIGSWPFADDWKPLMGMSNNAAAATQFIKDWLNAQDYNSLPDCFDGCRRGFRIRDAYSADGGRWGMVPTPPVFIEPVWIEYPQ